MERQEISPGKKGKNPDGKNRRTPIANGLLLMNGVTAAWPPLDVSGEPIELGCSVFAAHDTTSMQRDHTFIVGGLRLQNVGGALRWVVCAHDDDRMYVESYADDCIVRRRAKPWGD